MGFSTSTSFTAVDKFSATLNKFQRGVSAFGKKAKTSFSKASRGLKSLDNNISKSMKRFAMLGAVMGGLSIGAFLQTATGAVLGLDRNISAAAAKFGEFDRTSDTFKALEDRARELGATTEFTAGQAAEGLKNLATAGFTAEQSIKSLDTVLNLATATQSDMATASDVAGKTLAAFGLRSKDPIKLAGNLERVSDVLNKIITTTGFGNLDELLTTVGASGASAKAAGLEIEEWGAIVGKAVTAGIDASSAGSQLNMALTRLAKPPAEAAKVMKKLGITVKDSSGNFRNIFSILKDVEKGTKNMGTANKAAALSAIFGARAYKTIGIALDNGIDNVKGFSDELRKSGGTTKQMAELMRSGLSGMLASTQSAIEEVGISLGKTFDTEIKMAIKGITDIARKSGEWIKQNKEAIKTVARLAVTVIKIVVGIKALILAMKVAKGISIAYYTALGIMAVVSNTAAIAAGGSAIAMNAYSVAAGVATAAQWLWNAAMTANPIGLIIVAVAALIAGIILLVKNWDTVKEAVISFGKFAWKWIKKIGGGILSFLLLPLQLVLDAISKITGADWSTNLSKKLQIFRDGLTADVAVTQGAGVGSSQARTERPSPLPLISNTVTQEQIRNERTEKIQSSMIGINIKDETGRAEVDKKGTDIPIQFYSTAGAF